jgi:hypothetical protein
MVRESPQLIDSACDNLLSEGCHTADGVGVMNTATEMTRGGKKSLRQRPILYKNVY